MKLILKFSLLLSAAYDKSAAIIDIRSPSEVHRWKLSADVEKVEWNPHKPQEFLVSSEDGMVKKFDNCFELCKSYR